jgi:hypothetical protein
MRAPLVMRGVRDDKYAHFLQSAVSSNLINNKFANINSGEDFWDFATG